MFEVKYLLALNIYLLIGIFLYSFNRGAMLRDRTVMQYTRLLFSLYVASIIVLWPLSPYIRLKMLEKYGSYFQR